MKMNYQVKELNNPDMKTNVKANYQLNKFKVDSLQVRIPLKEEYLNGIALGKVTCQVSEDGEQVSAYSLQRSERTIHPRYKGDDEKEMEMRIPARIVQEFGGEEILSIGIKAKFLEDKYYEGICMENLREIQKYLSEAGIVIPLRELEGARVTDIDICYDVAIENETWYELMRYISREARAKNPNMVREHCNVKGDKKTITGITLGRDRSRATAKMPHIKYYHKTMERGNPEGMPEVGRYEITMRNSKTWNYNEINKPVDLKDLLYKMDEEEPKLMKFLKTITKTAYMEKTRTATTPKKNHYSTAELLGTLLIQDSVISQKLGNLKIETLVDRVLGITGWSRSDPRTTKVRKLMKKIYNDEMKGKEQLKREAENVEKLASELWLI
jgi:hypothetical protein